MRNALFNTAYVKNVMASAVKFRAKSINTYADFFLGYRETGRCETNRSETKWKS